MVGTKKKFHQQIPKEIGKFAGGVNLSLEGCLALTKHSGSVQLGSVLCGDQIARFEEDVHLLFHGPLFPIASGFYRRIDRLLNQLLLSKESEFVYAVKSKRETQCGVS